MFNYNEMFLMTAGNLISYGAVMILFMTYIFIEETDFWG